jgi:hypothetical protein
MTLRTSLLAVALAAGVATGVPALAKVSIVQTPSAALAAGSSYAWAPVWGVALGVPTPAIVNEITAQQLQAATDEALSAKGYRRIENPAEADLIVAYRVIMGHRVDADLDGRPAPFGPGRADYNRRTSQKTQGTLVLDLIERRTGRLVYRATSEKDVSSKDAEPQRLNSALKDMTKSLPSH